MKQINAYIFKKRLQLTVLYSGLELLVKSIVIDLFALCCWRDMTSPDSNPPGRKCAERHDLALNGFIPFLQEDTTVHSPVYCQLSIVFSAYRPCSRYRSRYLTVAAQLNQFRLNCSCSNVFAMIHIFVISGDFRCSISPDLLTAVTMRSDNLPAVLVHEHLMYADFVFFSPVRETRMEDQIIFFLLRIIISRIMSR